MKAFAALYDAIDASTSTQAKVAALVAFFRDAPPADAAWAVAFLVGRRPKRLVRAPDLRAWAAEAADIPAWLFEEAYAQAGDLAETITLLVPPATHDDDASLSAWVETRLLPLARMEAPAQQQALRDAWSRLRGSSRFVFNKLITGGFRVGVSDGLVARALAEATRVERDVIAHRLMGQWEPTPLWFTALARAETSDADWSRPYPFFLAHPLDDDVATLGARTAWLAEWKWDGIRAQVVRRRDQVVLWSRGEELLTGRFPEVEATCALLPDGTVLDGELLAWRDERPLPFTALQRRLNRKQVSNRLRHEVPVCLVAYDCLELAGNDLRALPLAERRDRLAALVAAFPGDGAVRLSPAIEAADWSALRAARAEARSQEAEGLMLKRLDSAYGVGRRGSDWWKWKVTPLTIDAVLVYAQAGHGRRAGLYTDYTFALRDGDALVPFAKAYSGLTDAEIREVDRFIRAHTLEKFGPVRTVAPQLVFELAFEGIQESTRHKSGLAVRFPRIARWRRDKSVADADTLETVRAMLRATRGETRRDA